MFGLMKNTGCMQANQQDWYRMHYCGTCKSIGRIYGQKSRILLNFDCVFLAEILSVIQETDTDQWDPKLNSHNCFSMPEAEALPLNLQYAADINLILADMKVRDNLQDDLKVVWKQAQRFLKKPFAQKNTRLSKWGIDQQTLHDYQVENARREASVSSQEDVSALLAWYAEPSAAITGYLFAKGVDAIDKPDSKETMSQMGYAFGELVYGLDAWKDVENDEEEGAFNLLLLNSGTSLESQKKIAADWIWKKAEGIQQIINESSFPAEVKTSLTSRLMLNVASTLGESGHVCTPQSGIEKATVPRVARAIGKVNQKIGAWANPLKPARFAASYIAFMLVIFHQRLFSAAYYGAEDTFSLDFGLIGALVAAPVGMYLLAKGVSKNRKWFARKMENLPKKLKKRLKRFEKKATKKDGKLKWWGWVLLILGGFIVLLLLLLIIAIADSASSCGGGSGDCCGNCDCGCGDCGNCDCGGCDCNC